MSLSSANPAVPSASQPASSNPRSPDAAGKFTMLCGLSSPCQFCLSQDVAEIM